MVYSNGTGIFQPLFYFSGAKVSTSDEFLLHPATVGAYLLLRPHALLVLPVPLTKSFQVTSLWHLFSRPSSNHLTNLLLWRVPLYHSPQFWAWFFLWENWSHVEIQLYIIDREVTSQWHFLLLEKHSGPKKKNLNSFWMWLPRVDSDLEHSLPEPGQASRSRGVKMSCPRWILLGFVSWQCSFSTRGTALTYSKACLDAFKRGAFQRDAVSWFPRDQSLSNNSSHPLETESLFGKHNNGSTWTDVTLGNCLAHFKSLPVKREGATTKQISLQTNVQEPWA